MASVIPTREYDDGFLVMVTKRGIIKKTEMSKFKNIRESGLIALNIRDDDELVSVLRTSGQDEVFIATNNGVGIRFNESGVRQLGRTATGVKGIKLGGEDCVIGAVILSPDNTEQKVLFVSENGFGKCTGFDEFRLQSRSGKGTRAYKITPKTGKLLGIELVTDKDELMLINSDGVIIRIRIGDISTSGRNAMGVKLINLGEGVTVVGLAKVAEEVLGEEAEEVVEDGIE